MSRSYENSQYKSENFIVKLPWKVVNWRILVMSNITQGKIINLFHSTVSIYEVISNDYATNSIIFK